MPLIDFSVRGSVSKLAGLVRDVRKIIFWGTKEEMWKAALTASRAKGADRQPDQVCFFVSIEYYVDTDKHVTDEHPTYVHIH